MSTESTPIDPGQAPIALGQPPVEPEQPPVDPAERRQTWLRHLMDEFIKMRPLFPFPDLVPEEGCPQWVHNVESEFGAMMFPLAKLKEDYNFTPRRIGALIGHSCAVGVWMMDCLEQEINQAEAKPEPDLSKFTAEQIEHAQKVLKCVVFEWYPALRRFAKRALCSCVDQPYEDMTEFLTGYTNAFSRKPKKPGMADIGNPATEIHFLMLTNWRLVNALRSVHQLHQVLVGVFGSHRVGDLKRIEKICQRIELSYRKPGRPKEIQ
jgi:hypothetical protein